MQMTQIDTYLSTSAILTVA